MALLTAGIPRCMADAAGVGRRTQHTPLLLAVRATSVMAACPADPEPDPERGGQQSAGGADAFREVAPAGGGRRCDGLKLRSHRRSGSFVLVLGEVLVDNFLPALQFSVFLGCTIPVALHIC